MKKIMSLGLFVLGLSLMSVSATPIEEAPVLKKYPLVTVVCPDGYESTYYDIGYSDADIADIENAICN